MCYLIFGSLFGLLWLYSDSLMDAYVLAVTGNGSELMGVAMGWEIVPLLWPVLLMAMILASAMTLMVVRRFGRRPG